jgi:large subunit ribosomal protein L25
MERIEVTITKRDTSRHAHAVRKEGLLPGIVYGAGGADVAVTVDLRTFERAGLSGAGSHLVHFSSPETSLDGNMALIRELQVNPLTGRAIHVDFLRIDMSKPVDAFVPLSFIGKPAGVVEGGILQPLRRELEVRALPDRLPNKIEVDVSPLQIGHSIHVADLKLPEGVEALGIQENFTLVTVVPPAVEEVAAPTVAPAEGTPEAAAAAAAAGTAGAEGSAATPDQAKKADPKKAEGKKD